MLHPPDETEVRASYDRLAAPYTELFADVARQHPVDRAVITAFAELVLAGGGGLVADLGCGPGHWTAYLHAHGLDALGIDLSPEFVSTARARYPEVRFDEGTMTDLDVPAGTCAGALSWFSTIHAPWPTLRDVLVETSRVLAPGGHLLIGFQAVDGDEEEIFDHRVVAAYRRPLDLVSRLLRDVGMVEMTRLLRQPAEGERWPTGLLIARRT